MRQRSQRTSDFPRPIILGIETSCDETAAAVVADGTRVLSNVIATQHALHEAYAGVVPEIASRAHLERIVPVLREALTQAGISLDDVDAIAVGHRPGLIGSLLVGVSAAKALAWSRGLPVVGVDHVVAHLHAPLLADAKQRVDASAKPADYPALGLVVSGGHTSLYFIKTPLEITRIGKTIDDAVGEAFDKAATMLGLGYPGGPAIDREARRGNPKAHTLPISLLRPESLDFSFSGLKTALLYLVHGFPERGESPSFERPPELSARQRADLAASFEHAAIAAVMKKLQRALERYPAMTVLVGGGVSANTLLRQRLGEFEKKHSVPVRLAAMEHCLDNAAMIAGAAAARYHAGLFDDLTLSAATSSAVG
jgi:N6-L-threonylcarbamoyladenine synthase